MLKRKEEKVFVLMFNFRYYPLIRYSIFKKALSLGYSSLEEYEIKMSELKVAANQFTNTTNATKRKGGLTEEGRMRISESLKKRWQDPVFRAAYSTSNR
jgi:hypothetical protein